MVKFSISIRATGAPPPKTFQLEAQCSRNQRSADCQVNGFSPRLFVSWKQPLERGQFLAVEFQAFA
jgi:hypothetical protein